MKILLTLTFLAAAFTISAAAQKLPRFAQYPTKVVRVGTIKVDLSTKDARMFRTNLKNAAKEGVNFAGRYVLTSWGCGTNCTQWAIIDGRNGKVVFPPQLAGAGFGLCDLPENAMPSDALAETDENYGGVFWKKDSRLLVLTGFKGGDLNDAKPKCGNYFFEWNGASLKQLRFVPGKPTM